MHKRLERLSICLWKNGSSMIYLFLAAVCTLPPDITAVCYCVSQLCAVLLVRTEVSVGGTTCAPVLKATRENAVKRVSKKKQ